MTITLTAATADVPGEWGDYVRAHPVADWYHDPRWALVFHRAYGLRSAYALAHDGPRVIAGAHLVACPRLPFGRRLIAGPFLAAGGWLMDAGVERAAVEAGLLAEARRQGYASVELREHDPVTAPVAGDLVTLRRALPASAGALWGELDPKVRNQIRKGQKSGVTVACGREQVGAFWSLYARHQWMLGTPTHGARFFEAMADVFGGDAEVRVAFKDGQPVGGLLAIHARGTTVALNACSRREFNALCVNHVLYGDALAGATARGARMFDFGRSVFGSGTFDFKRQWDAQPMRLRYVSLGRGAVAAPTESVRLKRAAVWWSALPYALACKVGPRLRPYLA
ncbi:MAG: GNAT family N-acetyltransferase [Lentisphaerae bacterium]|nr:GNAT family N-acetyltransferase [Lentisphaerota bacterium]